MALFFGVAWVLVGVMAAAPTTKTLNTSMEVVAVATKVDGGMSKESKDMLVKAGRAGNVKQHGAGSKKTPSMDGVLERKRSFRGLTWLDLPQGCCLSGHPAAVTYVGGVHQPYIDGASMLGLSLQRHAPHFPRICMILKTMPAKYKSQLAKAGWILVEVEQWHPHLTDHVWGNYWWDSYNKINVFRLNISQVLWMDADTYVWSDGLEDLFNVGKRFLPGQIAMVRDCNLRSFNSGVMLLQPDRAMFGTIREDMTVNKGWSGLDQPLINMEFVGRVVELPPKFNVHGYIGPRPEVCNTAVVAHYTGLHKPAEANQTNLRLVRDGYGKSPDPSKILCERFFRNYFCALKRDALWLSGELQKELKGVSDSGAGCPPRPDPKTSDPTPQRYA